ncbi:MAG TPA: hypothetical protein VL978_01535 [Puia sp.]|nr:hypothetical protein [Puia sp.]
MRMWVDEAVVAGGAGLFALVHYLWITKALAGKDFSQCRPEPLSVLHLSDTMPVFMGKITKAFSR